MPTSSSIELKSRDGRDLHGVLTLPPGSAGKNRPGVVQVNFRGSGGYGWAFMELGKRQWGRTMQDDVTDATRWAIAQGIADAKRICIYGASYGGYSAMMGPIREPGLYQCAIGRSGAFDLAKLYKWGSIRRSELGLKYLKYVLGEDPVELAANSPAQHADKIGLPVLLAHGTLDARVDIKHAKLMARELAKRKQSVELIEYSSTGHSVVLDRHRLDLYTRLLAFLDQHLGAAPVSE